MIDVVKDLSNLTSIPERTLNKLLENVVYIIGDGISEDKLNDKSEYIVEYNVGIGTLCIKYVGNDLGFKFVPSEEFVEKIKQSIEGEIDSLKESLEENLIAKFVNTYKELL